MVIGVGAGRWTGRVRSANGWRVLFACMLLLASPAFAGEDGQADGLLDALIHGKPTLDVRGRVELAKAEGLERSEAYTLRTRLGYGTLPWYGVRVYMDMENIATPTQKTYFDPTRQPNSRNQTVVADVSGTEVNQGFLEISQPDWLGSKLVAGRQRIVYDDARFIGDVVWRQNQQTYDGVRFSSTAGVEHFGLEYAWLGNVNRIFGGGGNNDSLRDFQSNSQLLHASFDAIPQAKLAAFAYLLDLELSRLANPYANSSMTFGFRASGVFDLAEKTHLDWVGSYSFQADYADNPADYAAHYAFGELGFKSDPIGRVGAGFEYLGSDDGAQQVQTPLSTAHKFNGWADVYLNNGGPTGLKDLFVSVSPKLPLQLGLIAIYHRFWDGDSGTVRGNELDAQLQRPFGKHVLVLAKGAWFVSASDAFAEVDTWRVTTDIEFRF